MEQKQEATQTLTISQQGPSLPLGITGVRDIALRPWRMKEEKELGELREKNRDQNMASYVSMVIGSMYTKMGPHVFETMKPEEKRVHISQMFMADVFYAYVWLRISALGSDMELKIACPFCGKKSQLTADLGTIEVKSVPELAKAAWEYSLKTPFTIRGKQVKSLLLAPPRWDSIESIPAGQTLNAGTAKAAVIRSSIIGLNGAEEAAPLADHELDEMSKLDIEKLTAGMEAHAVGPMMSLDTECQNVRCKSAVKMPIDWNYDSFFSSSSR